MTVDAEDACAKVRLALCGVGETPVVASEAVAFVVGQPCSDADAEGSGRRG